MLVCGGVGVMCRGNTNAVWNEAESEAFRGAMGETQVVQPRVGECEEGSVVVRWGMVWEGFKAYHFREDGDCGGGKLELEVLL